MDKPEILKLSNGDEIIGVAKTDGGQTIHVQNPLQIIAVPRDGEMSLGFMPFMPYTADGSVMVMTSNVVVVAEPNQEMTDAYNRHFSKIVLPPTGIVAP